MTLNLSKLKDHAPANVVFFYIVGERKARKPDTTYEEGGTPRKICSLKRTIYPLLQVYNSNLRNLMGKPVSEIADSVGL